MSAPLRIVQLPAKSDLLEQLLQVNPREELILHFYPAFLKRANDALGLDDIVELFVGAYFYFRARWAREYARTGREMIHLSIPRTVHVLLRKDLRHVSYVQNRIIQRLQGLGLLRPQTK